VDVQNGVTHPKSAFSPQCKIDVLSVFVCWLLGELKRVQCSCRTSFSDPNWWI